MLDVSSLSVIKANKGATFCRYSISVRAFNSAGAGPASGPVNTLTKESGKDISIRNSPNTRFQVKNQIKSFLQCHQKALEESDVGQCPLRVWKWSGHHHQPTLITEPWWATNCFTDRSIVSKCKVIVISSLSFFSIFTAAVYRPTLVKLVGSVLFLPDS